MVISNSKWICGYGKKDIHYCEICGTPYYDLKDALDCEIKCKKENH